MPKVTIVNIHHQDVHIRRPKAAGPATVRTDQRFGCRTGDSRRTGQVAKN